MRFWWCLLFVGLLNSCFLFEAQTPPADESVRVDWNQRVIVATGHGKAPQSENEAQKRLMAIRAAELDAKRKLVGFIYGMKVNKTTTFDQYGKQSEQVQIIIQGVISRAYPLNDPVYLPAEGKAEVTLGVRLSDLEAGLNLKEPIPQQ